MKSIDLIRHVVNTSPSPEAITYIERTHLKEYRMLSLLGLACCFICLAGGIVGIPEIIQLSALVPAVFCLTLRSWRKRAFENALTDILEIDCNPQRFNDYYLAYLSVGRPASNPVRGVWQYAYGLMWEGKFTTALRVIDTLKPELANAAVAYTYASLIADCSFALRNNSRLVSYREFMLSISNRKISRLVHSRSHELDVLAQLLEAEQESNYEKARALLDTIWRSPRLSPVERILYTLHKAQCAPTKEEQIKALEFVSQHGGSTWCARKAYALLHQESHMNSSSEDSNRHPSLECDHKSSTSSNQSKDDSLEFSHTAEDDIDQSLESM